MGSTLLIALLVRLVASSAPSPSSVPSLCTGTTTAAEVAASSNLTGFTAVVTGGDGGLGFPITLALASRGASVVIASRNLSKCQKAARDIAQQTGSNVTALTLDLGSLASVRQAAAVLNANRIDLLVNNAGIAGNPHHLTEDGFQLLFQVNYLGPFLLTHLLLPSLRESKGRVVNVASSEQAIACQAAGWPANCLADLHLLPPAVLPDRNVTIHYNDGMPTELRPIELYGVTKSLLIQHAAELARREHGIIAYSLTPGWVNTSINHIQPADLNTTMGRRKCYEQRGSPCPFIPEQGAAVIAVCALEYPAPSGAYISRPGACRREAPAPHGFSDSMGALLYSKSLQWANASMKAMDVVV